MRCAPDVSARMVVMLGMLLLVGCVTVQEKESLAMVPMYGLPDVVRDSYLVSEDEAFVEKQLKRFDGNQQAASREQSKRAHELLSYGQIQKAMEHFNRAWLLDKRNAQAHWGFGQILVVRGKVGEAIEHLEKAKALGVVAFQQPALLVDTGIAYSIRADQSSQIDEMRSRMLFAQANHNFQQSSELAPDYGEVWRRWSFSLLREKRHRDAWLAIKKARSLGVKKFPPSFIKELSAAYPDPG